MTPAIAHLAVWITGAAAHLRRVSDREDGQAMVEYALILGLISVVAIAALTALGTDVKGVLTAVETAFSAVPGA